jgi:hypothetical protein
MSATIHREVHIEDLRNQQAETETLRNLIEAGATFIPDPKRTGFYEVASGSLVFYIHVSPVTGNILLLAAWPNDAGRSSDNYAA